ncbi:uncharacterized protein NECHADRAFT_86630 [Fusarium vanettenii 77-13-4]|uniref:Transcription factor domain-containing protein n=1 Tax=Fusarium vanettenii (strain ATCC MYA-4622 / CBS 123669 / FGSC 9596 / NRRL 45880 / 77-13-4) TaxID=660122 RepID=C7ZG16_FUSV7|nr:uncharacterized protein NECHADRAFT_86630 [Fusarium vanettenii 77-13-4]EEU37074.1 predicted protein [Fusarium vanettenii 77-13-4]
MHRDGSVTKTRRGLRVTREKHQGISFVNATTVAKVTENAHFPTTKLKFVPEKRQNPRQAPRLVTDDDLERVQGGENRRIAPRADSDNQGRDAAKDTYSAIPYQSVASRVPRESLSFPLIKAWRQLNEAGTCYVPSPSGITLPDWALHGLPAEIPDEGRKCFHAYLFSCPLRHYPFEQLQVVSWQPLSMDQSRFERLMLEPLMLNCTMTMGALFLLLKSGTRELAGFSMHSAKLCALVNKLLGDKEQTISKMVVIIQSIASLAILATFLGLYDHWLAHLNGLKLLVQAAGGLQVLPLPVQILVKKADLKGASEIVTTPFFTQARLQRPISESLPRDRRMAIEADVQLAIRPYDGACDNLCDTIASLATLVATIDFAASQRGSLIFDPLALTEEYHGIEYRLLMTSVPIQTRLEALDRCLSGGNALQHHDSLSFGSPSDMQHGAKRSVDIILRLAALFFLKMVKGGPPDTLYGLVHMMQILNEHMRRITHLPLSMATNSPHGLSRSALIWIALMADKILRRSDSEGWNWGSRRVDRHIPRDLLVWALSGGGVRQDDFRLCRILDLGRFEVGVWDPRAHIEQILAS